MKRTLSVALLALAAAVPMFAQAPDGWKMRIDRSTSASDPDGAGEIQFTTIPGGFHAVNPAAAIFYNPANTASGTYTLKGTFKLMEPSGHENTYGLILGGANLETTEQNYLYFLVSQEGKWLITRREGDQMPDPNAATQGRGRGRGGPRAITRVVAEKQVHEAVQQPGADGTSVNTLEVRVMADTVDFVVNGTVVHSGPKASMLGTTDGIYGIRVNHQLNVQITDFGISQ